MIAFQVTMNGTRLGIYPALERAINGTDGQLQFAGKLAAGAIAGAVGALLGSPLFMVSLSNVVPLEEVMWQ